MKSFFNSLQSNRSKYAGAPAAAASAPNANLSTSSINNNSISNIDLNQSSSSSSGASHRSGPGMRLDSTNLVAFVDILEQTVKQKMANPNIVIEIKDNPEIMSIVNQFISGGCTKIFLEQHAMNNLWSAAMKIIHMSDPILSAKSCESLGKLKHETMGLPDNPVDNTNQNLTNGLPIYHQRLLGALFSASDMMIRLDAKSATAIADSVSNALIWNSAPGSSSNHRAFCNLIHNQCENFPYYYTFADRMGLLVKPIDSNEWMAILSEGNSGVIVGYSAALNPDYRHNPGGGGGGGGISRRVSDPSILSADSSSLMKSVDLSTIPGNSRIEILEEKPWLPSPNKGGRVRNRDRDTGISKQDDSLLSISSPDTSLLGMMSFDKRSNTPNLGAAPSLENSPVTLDKKSALSLEDSNTNPNKYTFPSVTRMSPALLDPPLPISGNINNPNAGINPPSSNTQTRGIAMQLSSENLTKDTVTTNYNNRNNRATEGRWNAGESWDDDEDDENSISKEMPPMNQANSSSRDNTKKNPGTSTTPTSVSSSPSIYVKLKDLQNVFSSSLVSASSLEYRSFRNIDFSEDYADVKALRKNIDIFIGNKHLNTLLDTNGKYATARHGYISWTDFLQVSQALLSDADREYLRNNRVGYDDDLPASLSVQNTGKGAANKPQASSIYDDFDDDSMDEIDAKADPKGVTKGGSTNTAKRTETKSNDNDLDTSVMMLDQSTTNKAGASRFPQQHLQDDEDSALEESNSSFISIPELPTNNSSFNAGRGTASLLNKKSSWDDAKPTARNAPAKSILEDDDDSDIDQRKEQAKPQNPRKEQEEKKRNASDHSDLEDDDDVFPDDIIASVKARLTSANANNRDGLQRKSSNNSSTHSMSNYSNFSLTESTVSNLTGSVATATINQAASAAVPKRDSRLISTTTPSELQYFQYQNTNSTIRNTVTNSPAIADEEDKGNDDHSMSLSSGSGGAGGSGRKWRKRVDLADVPVEEEIISGIGKKQSFSSKKEEKKMEGKFSFVSDVSPSPHGDDDFDFSPIDGGDQRINSTNNDADSKRSIKLENPRKDKKSTFSLTSIDPESDSGSPTHSPVKQSRAATESISSFVPLETVPELHSKSPILESLMERKTPPVPHPAASGNPPAPSRALSTDSAMTAVSSANNSTYDMNRMDSQQLTLETNEQQGNPHEHGVFESISLDSPEKRGTNAAQKTETENHGKKKGTTAKSILGYFIGKNKHNKKDSDSTDAAHVPSPSDTEQPVPVTQPPISGDNRRHSFSSESTVTTSTPFTPAPVLSADPQRPSSTDSATTSSGGRDRSNSLTGGAGAIFSKVKDAFKFTSMSRNSSPSRVPAETPNTSSNPTSSSAPGGIASLSAATVSSDAGDDTSVQSKPNKFPFLSGNPRNSKTNDPHMLRVSSGRIELNPVDFAPPSTSPPLPRDTILSPKETTSKAPIPAPSLNKNNDSTVPPLAEEKTVKNVNPKKPVLSVAATVQMKQQEKQEKQGALTHKEMDPALVMINEEKPTDVGYQGNTGIGIADRVPSLTNADTALIPPPVLHRSSSAPTSLQKPLLAQVPLSSAASVLSDETPAVTTQQNTAVESSLPPLKRINSTSVSVAIPPKAQRSVSLTSANPPVLRSASPADLGNSRNRFLSGRGLASRIRKTNQIGGATPPQIPQTVKQTVDGVSGAYNAPLPSTSQRLSQLMHRSNQINHSLANRASSVESSLREVVSPALLRTSTTNALPGQNGSNQKKTMADRLIDDMKSLYKHNHPTTSHNDHKEKVPSPFPRKYPHFTSSRSSAEGEEEVGEDIDDDHDIEESLPLLLSYWNELKENKEPRSLFLKSKDINYYKQLIDQAKSTPPPSTMTMMKEGGSALLRKGNRIYKYEELNIYYDKVQQYHISPFVQRMLDVLHQQEDEVVAKGIATSAPMKMTQSTGRGNGKTKIFYSPIHYIPDPLFGLHIFNTTLLLSHLQEFQRQKRKEEERKQHLLLNPMTTHDNSSDSNAMITNQTSKEPTLYTHLQYQINPQILYNIIHQNLFYTELQSILGIKYSGFLLKYLLSSNPASNTRYKKRFFTLMILPKDNPNISALVSKSSSSTLMKADGMETSESPSSSPSSSSAPNEYILVEYRRMVESAWGEIPLQIKRYYYLKDLLYILVNSDMKKEGKEFTICFRITGSELDTDVPIDRKVMKHVANLEGVKNIDETLPSSDGIGDNLPKTNNAASSQPTSNTEIKSESGDTMNRAAMKREKSQNKAEKKFNLDKASSEIADGEIDEEDEEEEDEKEEDDEDENAMEQFYYYRSGTTVPTTNDGKNTGNAHHPSEEAKLALSSKKMKAKTWIKVTLLATTANERVQWIQILQSVAPDNVYINTLNYQ